MALFENQYLHNICKSSIFTEKKMTFGLKLYINRGHIYTHTYILLAFTFNILDY